jgi:ring-1,2-phenylacetyl-CoA epoxidase subunit PaaA
MTTELTFDATTTDPPPGIWFGSELERLGGSGFDEGDPLPDEYRELITQVVMVQADLESELVFDSTYLRNLLLSATNPRSKMRMAKFFAEEVNHGYTFWRIAKGLGIELTGRYFREAKRKRQEAFQHIALVSDWTELAIVNTLTDRMGVFVFKDMERCSYRPWAEVALDVARDEVGHTALGVAHLREEILLHGRLDEAQQHLEKWYPMALDMFGRSNSARQWRYVAWGIKASGNEKLRRAFATEVNPILEQSGLRVPGYYENRKFL